MTGRIEPYCVSTYNTSKQSENKIHDDAVARRFGFSGGLVPCFASSPIPYSTGGPIPWFGSRLVQQIGRELLARPFRRQQLLRAGGSPSEAPAGPLSLPGLSVPPSFRLRVGRHLT